MVRCIVSSVGLLSPKTFVLRRGSPENPRDEVMPAGFKALGGNLKMSSNTPERSVGWHTPNGLYPLIIHSLSGIS